MMAAPITVTLPVPAAPVDADAGRGSAQDGDARFADLVAADGADRDAQGPAPGTARPETRREKKDEDRRPDEDALAALAAALNLQPQVTPAVPDAAFALAGARTASADAAPATGVAAIGASATPRAQRPPAFDVAPLRATLPAAVPTSPARTADPPPFAEPGATDKTATLEKGVPDTDAQARRAVPDEAPPRADASAKTLRTESHDAPSTSAAPHRSAATDAKGPPRIGHEIHASATRAIAHASPTDDAGATRDTRPASDDSVAVAMTMSAKPARSATTAASPAMPAAPTAQDASAPPAHAVAQNAPTPADPDVAALAATITGATSQETGDAAPADGLRADRIDAGGAVDGSSSGDVRFDAGLFTTAPARDTRAAAAAATAPLPSVDSPRFADVLGARLGWLADHRIGHAEIRLAPPSLGELDVRLHLDGERVRAEFGSAHADVRHAIERDLPRLRDLLADRGFTLIGAHVGGGGDSGGAREGTQREMAAALLPIADAAVSSETVAAPRARSGLVDEFA